MKWDSETNSFGASEEDWRNYLKANPEAAHFQHKEIQFKDKLDIIFDEAIGTSEMTSSTTRKRQNDDSTTYHLRVKERGRKLRSVGRDSESDSDVSVDAIPTSKATWTSAYHKIFVDLCLEETLKGNKTGTRFTKEGWRNIVESFYATTGVRYDKKQVKNHYDSTRKQWKTWLALTADGSMKWDPETNEFGASEEDWSNYIKAIPEAAQFRFKEIQFTDKLDVIFEGGTWTGEMKTLTRLKRQNDASATSHMRGTEHEKKRKTVGRDCELKSAIMVNATPLTVVNATPITVVNATPITTVNATPITTVKATPITTVNATPITTVTSEHSMSSSSCPKVKATWTPAVHKIFVDLCLQEKLKGNKPGTHFTKEGWKNIMEFFYLETGLNYGRLQLKNHWDSTKEQWRIWSKLISTSYMKWDPSNQKFEASEDDWTNYLQANPEAAQFRNKELQFTDMLETIFNGTAVTGENEPAVQQRKSDDSVVTSFPSHAKEPGAARLVTKDERLGDAIASRNGVKIQKNAVAATSSSSEGKLNYSIGECIECLDRMEEMEQGSDLYMFALDVFLKQEYREIFLQLKNSNLRISWLQRLQSAGPPLL